MQNKQSARITFECLVKLSVGKRMLNFVITCRVAYDAVTVTVSITCPKPAIAIGIGNHHQFPPFRVYFVERKRFV